MTRALRVLVVACCPILAFGQLDRTFHFAQPPSPDELTATMFMALTVTELRDVAPDETGRAIVAHGPAAKLDALEWIFHQLEATKAPAEYDFAGETVAVIPAGH
jgi:hypothetical protein